MKLRLERRQESDYVGIYRCPVCVLQGMCVMAWGRDSYSQCSDKPLTGIFFFFFLRKNDIIAFALRYHSSHFDFPKTFGTVAFTRPYNTFIP